MQWSLIPKKDDDKASVGGALILDFMLFDESEEGTETLAGTTESAKDEISTLEPLNLSLRECSP